MSNIKRYWSHFKYTMKHKHYVFLECCKFGIPVRGLAHDMSKFGKHEFKQYARFFFNDDGVKKESPLKNGGDYTTADDDEFISAWHHHLISNKHHWEHWVITRGDGTCYPIEMPCKCVWEMVSDWNGAARAKGTGTGLDWYTRQKDKMILHDNTRHLVEAIIGYSAMQK